MAGVRDDIRSAMVFAEKLQRLLSRGLADAEVPDAVLACRHQRLTKSINVASSSFAQELQKRKAQTRGEPMPITNTSCGYRIWSTSSLQTSLRPQTKFLRIQ